MEAYSHLKSVVELKDEGNAEFRKGNVSRAVEKYKAALRKRETVSDEIRGSLQSNVAVCLVKLSRWEEAIEAATAVSEVRGDISILCAGHRHFGQESRGEKARSQSTGVQSASSAAFRAQGTKGGDEVSRERSRGSSSTRSER